MLSVTSTYSKVPLEGFGPSVGVVPADLTVVVDVQTVEFIQPVRDRLHGEKQERHMLKKQAARRAFQIHKWHLVFSCAMFV